MGKLRLAVIFGSKSDLGQCTLALQYLERSSLKVEIIGVYVRSWYLNMEDCRQLLRELKAQDIDVIIAGSSGTNHLAACCDAYLRNTLHDTKITVIGVALKNEKGERPSKKDLLSISEIPETQVIYYNLGRAFIGGHGFLRACQLAMSKNYFPVIPPKPVEAYDYDCEAAIVEAFHQLALAGIADKMRRLQTD